MAVVVDICSSSVEQIPLRGQDFCETLSPGMSLIANYRFVSILSGRSTKTTFKDVHNHKINHHVGGATRNETINWEFSDDPEILSTLHNCNFGEFFLFIELNASLITTSSPQIVLFVRKKDSAGGFAWECTEVGRFPDPSSSHRDNCLRSYVLCVADEGNWKSYSCPLGTRFSALEERCVSDPENYVDCYSSAETEMTELISDRITSSFSCPEKGVFRNSDSYTCQDYILCVNTMKTDLYAIYLHCAENQFFSESHHACIDKGKNYCDQFGHLNLINPPTQSSTKEHSEGASPSSMATQSALEQQQQQKITTDVMGKLPVAEVTQRTEASTHSPTTTTGMDTTLSTLNTRVERSSEEEDELSVEVEIVTTAKPLTPVYPQAIPKIFFTCLDLGRFESPFKNTTDCSYYILCCHAFNSFELDAFLFQCPNGTIFSKDEMRCVYGNVKSCSKEEEKCVAEVVTEIHELITSTTAATTIDYPSTTLPTITSTPEIDSTTTEEITTTVQEDTTSTTEQIIITTTTSLIPETTLIITDPITTTTPSPTDAPWNSLYQCKNRGRFHTDNTLDCRSYLLCTLGEEPGSFTGKYFRCPSGTEFSDPEGRCVKDYDCPYFYCTRTGRFPYVRDKKRFILCVPQESGKIIAYRMKCPESMVFSNIIRKCITKEMERAGTWK